MEHRRREIIEHLIQKGVSIPCPETVEIGPDLDPTRISGRGVTLHAGCRLLGPKTLILPGVELGDEAPVTVHNCQVGKDVKLSGGFFHDCCFLEGAIVGSGAQFRGGCLMEERSRAAHTVGLKQTILFPYVTLGSLINFCDCLMAGGTSEEDHSEVGSSYIHFNYTPNQDKATASLIGDVPRGVMLKERPIFLGGQGGVVGPVRIGYGVVVAAGTLVRKDLLEENTILLGQSAPARKFLFHPGLYANPMRLIQMNTRYIANLIALRRWYLDVRGPFASGSEVDRALHQGAVDKVQEGLRERLVRFGQVAGRMERSIEIYQEVTSGRAPTGAIRTKKAFAKGWPEMEKAFLEGMDRLGDEPLRERFLEGLNGAARGRGPYLSVIKGLGPDVSDTGTRWLQGLVDRISEKALQALPGLPFKRG
jgi:bifunctional UDP-N-acetylglucosamine pyrophosphorylase/glucosamine-1-phosphate N-acetyltransferase